MMCDGRKYEIIECFLSTSMSHHNIGVDIHYTTTVQSEQQECLLLSYHSPGLSSAVCFSIKVVSVCGFILANIWYLRNAHTHQRDNLKESAA